MQIMDSQETAKLLDLSYSKFMALFYGDKKNHPPYILFGKERKFIKEDVEEWVKSRRIKAPE